jgi:hypothetical protein
MYVCVGKPWSAAQTPAPTPAESGGVTSGVSKKFPSQANPVAVLYEAT